MAETLEAVAGVDEVSVNEEIRRAIAAHIEARRRDTAFRKRLEASIEFKPTRSSCGRE